MISVSRTLHCLIDKVFPYEFNGSESSGIRALSDKSGAFEGRNAMVDEVPLDKIHPGQCFIRPEHIVELYECMNEWENTAFPTAIKAGDEYYLLDGHHRVMAKLLAKAKTMKMKITEVSMEKLDEMKKRKKSITDVAVNSEEDRRKRMEELHAKIMKHGGLQNYLDAKFKNITE